MASPGIEAYAAVVVDWEPIAGGGRGICPHCDQPGFTVKREPDQKLKEWCEHGCKPGEIRDAVRALLIARRGEAAPKNGSAPAGNRQNSPVSPIPVAGAKPGVAIYSAADLMGFDLAEPKEIVPGFIYEGFNLFAGKGKTGKSWYALDICIPVAVGGKAFGTVPVEGGDVLYLALEDTQRRMKKRLKQRLHGEAAPPNLSIAHEWPRIGEGCLEEIRRWLDAHPKARMVVIDVLKKVKPRRIDNRGVYDEDFDFAGHLKKIADEYAVGIVGVTHTRKAAADDVFDEVNASSGLTGAADAIVIWHRSRGKDTARLSITGRDVDEEKADETAIVLQWHKLLGTWTILGNAGEVEASDERKRIIELLKASKEPLSPHAIAQALEKNPVTTRRLLGLLAESGTITRTGYGKYTYTLMNSVNSEQFMEK